MSQTVIAYDKDLPEIPGRCPWEKPTSFLVKDITADTGWSENKAGRRPSNLLLIAKLRKAVDAWRKSSYPGISETGRRLFEYWFDEDHEVIGFSVPFRYHFCQREAIETLVYLVEIYGKRDAKQLITSFSQITKRDLLSQTVEFQTTMDGTRQIRRYVAELDKDGVQDLPPEDLFRLAFKMATGSGKTWVMAMAIVYSHFHKKREPNSSLSTNFLVVAPNIIVYQRLERDFASNAIFNQLPLVPPEWRPWNQKVILRGDNLEADPSANLFLTNIQQLYEARDQVWTPANAVETLLGKKPSKDLSANQPSMLERVKGLKHLVVINDEAHHVHDADLKWSQSLMAIHKALPNGLSLWLDFSATPKDQGGMYYPWIIVDYPLAQAVEDRIVKAPLMVTKQSDPKRPNKDPENVTKENVTEKYRYWIEAAVDRWKQHSKSYKKLAIRPVLFIMAEKNSYADALGEYLWQTKEFGFKESEVLVIHTDEAGEVTKKDLDLARQVARDIDKPTSTVKAIVSVMMLREGWDVKNVSVVLGLRPFTATAEILPEQVIGRGLRLMNGVGPDRIQTLEVLGTRKLLEVLKDQLEAEGVGVASTDRDPPKPVIIEPLLERKALDIALPITKPRLTHNVRKLSELDVSKLAPIYDEEDLAEPFRLKLKFEFAPTETEVHQTEVAAGPIPLAQELIGSITTKVIQRAKLANVFAELYPLVRAYITDHCFGKTVDLEDETIRSHLYSLEIQEGIAKYLARKIAELTVEKRELEFDKAEARLSHTKPFHWKRNLSAGPLTCKRTIFNYVATYNDFERRFAKMLDAASDVRRFASLGTTEQGESGTPFKVDYLKPSGAIGFYYPDWVVVQKTAEGEVNWIIETKGRVWEGTDAKDEAINDWCTRISNMTGQTWKFCRVNQSTFEHRQPKTLADAVDPTTCELRQMSMALPKGPFYAFTQEIQRSSSEVHLTFDTVSRQAIRQIPTDGRALFAALSDMPSYVVQARVAADAYKSLVDNRTSPEEGQWYLLNTSSEGNMGGSFFDGVSEMNLGVERARLSLLPEEERSAIVARIRLPSEVSPVDIESTLTGVPTGRTCFVAVYNVGQGLCCALCDAKTSAPLIYFDFGAGAYQNARTRPPKLRFCFAEHPPVLLSHWHFDHFMAAIMLDKRAQDMKWVAPSQKIGPTTAKFAASLYLNGNLLIYPPGLASMPLSYGRMVRCSGTTMNSSGLAFTIQFRCLSSAPSTTSVARVLLPGDSGYDAIASIGNGRFDALVLPHHGGSFSGAVPPPVDTGSPFAISYGDPNSYDHPDDKSVSAHIKAGWLQRLDTKNGHIALCWPKGVPIPSLGCIGEICDLQIVQA